MAVLRNATIETVRLPGLIHQTVAGLDQGIYTMEVWLQTLAPGATTPLQRHDCEAVFVVLSGAGECRMKGTATAFGPDSTLVIEAGALHQLANTSDEAMRLVAALGMTPVASETADGQPLVPPWRLAGD